MTARRIRAVCAALALCLLFGCAGTAQPVQSDGLGNSWQPERRLELAYAEQFAVDFYSGGHALITVADGSRFLVVPEEQEPPEDIAGDIVVLQQPVEDIYLVATSAMCLFDALGTMDSIRLSGTQAENWYIGGAKEAMQRGDMLYAGKYSAPDYERIVSQGCRLAIQSTMIFHSPDVREKLENLGIPVLVDHSSYEPHPLGRTEWIKLYGVLTGHEALAQELFAEQSAYLDEVADVAASGKTVAFFYISSSGYAVARRSGDYVANMIELAGGRYVFDDLGEPGTATSTVNLEMEQFYATAKEADVLIYNSAIDGVLSSLDELLQKSSLLGDFAAVRQGNVWCTTQNMFQETTELGLMTRDIQRLLSDEAEQLTELHYFYRLQ